MDLGDVMRELGLDMFASSSVSSGSATGEDDGPDALDDLEEPDGPEAQGDQDSAPPREEDFEEFDDSDPDPDGEGREMDAQVMDRLDDISHQLDQLASEVEDNNASVKALRSERDEVIERLDRIEDNNATLLGVYDRLTNDINPFAADWNEKYDEKISEQDDQPYGVIEPPENEAEARAAARETAGESTVENEDGLTFEDLKDKHEDGTDDEETAESETDGVDEVTTTTESETEEPPDPEPEQDPHGAPAPHRDPAPNADPDPHATGADSRRAAADGATHHVPPRPGVGGGDEPYLDSLASNFATEVLMMEWLSMLIDVAGPAGAMKALDFYARINWISPEIERRLENVLSGAHGTNDVPSRPPSDLTAEEHNRSFAHIMRLAQQQGFARSRGE